jgi:two-component system, LytTR family, response regulator
MRETMARLEHELDPEEFARIHRSALVRIDRVAELLPSPHGDFRVTLKSGAQLTLSRFYRERLERVLRRAL